MSAPLTATEVGGRQSVAGLLRPVRGPRVDARWTPGTATAPRTVWGHRPGGWSGPRSWASGQPKTSNSETWAPFWTLLAVKDSCTYWSLLPAGRVTETVLPVAGSKV